MFAVLISAFLLINVVVTENQSSQELDVRKEGQYDLNQMCGPLNDSAWFEDDHSWPSVGCEVRQQIYDVVKFRDDDLWDNQDESAIEEIWSKDVVVYYFKYEEPFRGVDAWTQNIIKGFNKGLNPDFVELLEFTFCGVHPQALVLWTAGPSRYARSFMKFKIENGRWKIFMEIIQKLFM